ncbi:MAG: transporter [Candidatus Aminicenantes bacterium]|nr:MAG: transporter [Candidatus Aminicenantes bacterium]
MLRRRTRLSLGLIVMISLASFVISPAAQAQALEPRLYSNLPAKMNFLIVGYGYSQGDVLVDPTLPIEDINARIHLPILAYVRSLNILGHSGKLDVVLPFAWLSGSGKVEGGDQTLRRKISGFGDPLVRFTVNLHGAPALPLKEFVAYRQKTVVGFSFQASVPLGQYDPSKLGNIGTNRWMFKPEIGLSQALGRWILEASAAVNFYSTNDNFWGGKVRKQNPILSVQGHAIYNFRSGAWTALDITYYRGGRTTVDGEAKNDLQTNWRLGATLALPINRRNSIKFYGSTGLYTRTGTNFDAVGMAWQYRWGGGF